MNLKTLSILIILCLPLIACEGLKKTDNDKTPPEITNGITDEETAPPEDEVDVVEEDPLPVLEGYEQLGEATGDLDNDGVDEKVVVYNTPRETDMGTEREIHIYKKKDKTWTLWHTSIGAVLPSEHGGMMGDPFHEVDVERGCIVFNQSGGSRHKWAYTHRFRNQNGGWHLIGATVEFGAPCETWENYDYNLSNGKIIYKKETEDCDGEEGQTITKTETKDFIRKMDKLPEMDGFYPGDNELKIPNSDQSFYF